MKTIIKNTIAIVLLTSTILFSCSKNDDTPAVVTPPQVQVLPRAELFKESVISTTITDAVSENGVTVKKETIISFTFNDAENPKIVDFKKMRLDLNISHTYAGDLEFALIAPNTATSFFVYRAGGGSNYIAANKMRFGPQFTKTIDNTGITSANLLAGDFKECKGEVYPAVNLIPIFSTFQGNNVNGIWKLRITDFEFGDTGTIENVRLTFESGSIK